VTELQQRRTGRPPKTSADQILDAAALFEPAELQLTTLAERLGISVKTVYYYFPNRRALVDALTERTVAEIGLPDLDQAISPRAVLEEVARWTYRLADTQPNWYLLSAAPRGLGVRALVCYIARMEALGLGAEPAALAYVAVTSYAMGAGENARNTRELGGTSLANIARQFADYGDERSLSLLQGLIADSDVVQWFEKGLKVVLAGVESDLLRR
jgi:TetR/AcrR family transcriptional regulator, tetracycline repressor protein